MEAFLKTEYPYVFSKFKNLLLKNIKDIDRYRSDIEMVESYLKNCPTCKGIHECINKYEPGQYCMFRDEEDERFLSLNYAVGFCRHEKARIEQEKINKLLKTSRISRRFEQHSLENYNENEHNKAAVVTIKGFIHDFNRDSGNGIMLVGPVGTGKTHLGVAVLKELIKLGIPGACVTVPELLNDIRQSYRDNDGNGSKLMELVKTVQVLMLDDLGTEKVSDWVQETLFVIINARYENLLTTIITTNCTPDDLEKRIGDRSVSRIMEMCKGILLSGNDYRKRDL